MATKHTLTAYAPFGLQPDSLEVLIKYTYSAGRPAVMYGTPQPADPEEVDLISVKLVYNQIDDSMQAMLTEWAGEYLSTDDGFEKACQTADADREGDR
jgi:hypothetical protein